MNPTSFCKNLSLTISLNGELKNRKKSTFPESAFCVRPIGRRRLRGTGGGLLTITVEKLVGNGAKAFSFETVLCFFVFDDAPTFCAALFTN